jgi:hypothetical protein
MTLKTKNRIVRNRTNEKSHQLNGSKSSSSSNGSNSAAGSSGADEVNISSSSVSSSSFDMTLVNCSSGNLIGCSSSSSMPHKSRLKSECENGKLNGKKSMNRKSKVKSTQSKSCNSSSTSASAAASSAGLSLINTSNNYFNNSANFNMTNVADSAAPLGSIGNSTNTYQQSQQHPHNLHGHYQATDMLTGAVIDCSTANAVATGYSIHSILNLAAQHAATAYASNGNGGTIGAASSANSTLLKRKQISSTITNGNYVHDDGSVHGYETPSGNGGGGGGGAKENNSISNLESEHFSELKKNKQFN